MSSTSSDLSGTSSSPAETITRQTTVDSTSPEEAKKDQEDAAPCISGESGETGSNTDVPTAENEDGDSHMTPTGVDSECDNGSEDQGFPDKFPSAEDRSEYDSATKMLEYELIDDIKASLPPRYMEAGLDRSNFKKSARYKSRQALSYFVLVEARIKELESEVSQLKEQNAKKSKSATSKGELENSENDGDESDKGDAEPDQKSRWVLKPAWKILYDFKERGVDHDNIIEVLTEPMTSEPLKVRQQVHRHRSKTAHSVDENELADNPEQKRDIHRVKILSPMIVDAFAAVMGANLAPSEEGIHLRPFKAMLAYHDDIKEHFQNMQEQWTKTKAALETSSGAEEKDAPPEAIVGDLKNDKVSNEAPGNGEDKSGEALEHVKAYLEFVDEYLKPDLASYRQYRSRIVTETSSKVSFGDLWKVFAPGDIIYSPADRQASHVLSVAGGRPALRNRGTDGEVIDDDKSEGSISDFVVTCFSLDFDGTEVGPVQQDFRISHYEGSKSIIRLPRFPIEYSDLYDADQSASGDTISDDVVFGAACKRQLQERGEKFSGYAVKDQIAHKDYDGLTLGDVQEQIDSEIIIDLDKYYQLEKKSKPKLGFSDIEEADWRETTESWSDKCRCSDEECTIKTERFDKSVYDDRQVDRDRKERALKRIPEVVRWRSGGQDFALRTKHLMLFPRRIHGFALQTRKWREFDVDCIDDLPPNQGDNFKKDLVLPADHREIVQSLVDSHAMGPKSVAAFTGVRPAARSVQEDIVRGKGKGLIILLHGVPGVGKTSTAECVAQYARRPLYSITCGDLGETPEKVQEKLQESFNLAYRWSCVMLLDEADVLLAARDKSDLTRNAVVSVLLRTLEYYSGILFLTTNRVGVFDEAFKSRIHVSLFYQSLSRKQTLKIWRMNLDRLKETKPELKIYTADIMEWVKESWANMENGQDTKKWNGRQIHNAVRTAAALAAFKEGRWNELTVDTLKSVEKASNEFDLYLEMTTGHDDDDLAGLDLIRADPRKEELFWRRRSAQGSASPVQSRSNRNSTTKKQAQGGRQHKSVANNNNNRQSTFRNNEDDEDDEDEDEDENDA